MNIQIQDHWCGFAICIGVMDDMDQEVLYGIFEFVNIFVKDF